MFPEYRDLIAKLLKTDNYFATLFNRHSRLDTEITKITNSTISTFNAHELSALKREKLELKDQIYALLRKADPTLAQA